MTTTSQSTLSSYVLASVAEIVRAVNPVQVILFGSVARGDDTEDSDLDFLVVLDEVEPARKARLMATIRRAITAPVAVDVFVTDPRECERRRDVLGSMHYWPLREGKIVYERAA
jgi:uncharacterized protein